MSSSPQATLLSPTHMASPPQARELRSALSQLSYLIRRITNIESEHYRTAQGPQTSSHLDMLEQMTRAVERTVQELSVACQKVEALADRWRDALRQLSVGQHLSPCRPSYANACPSRSEKPPSKTCLVPPTDATRPTPPCATWSQSSSTERTNCKTSAKPTTKHASRSPVSKSWFSLPKPRVTCGGNRHKRWTESS